MGNGTDMSSTITNTTFPDHHKFLGFAEGMADITGEILLEASRSIPDVEFKADASFVTTTDKIIETRLREMIESEYPDHGIYGEEFPAKNIDAEFVWVLDPIDGTAPFIAGIPVFGTLISLAWKGKPFIGIIDHPATSDRWTGVSDLFAKRNGKAVTTKPCSGPESAFVTCSNPDFMSKEEHERFMRLQSVAPYVQYGGSCFSYGLLASGRTNIAIDSGFDPFDFYACASVISGAGGILTNWDGKEVSLDWSGGILAAGDVECHRKTIELIS
jgi:inositol-phosphate phosphatase/L-galactose 1-phosphate phosphatase/histidinol-phosphatase